MDREQVRRDAEAVCAVCGDGDRRHFWINAAHWFRGQDALNDLERENEELRAQLVKVPALVGLLREAENRLLIHEANSRYEAGDIELAERIREALAVFEQEQDE